VINGFFSGIADFYGGSEALEGLYRHYVSEQKVAKA
jgi:hypothetical protein